MPQINMKFIGTIILFLVLTTIDAHNSCILRGFNCINIHNCPEMLSIHNTPHTRSSEEWQILRNSYCGFEGDDRKVCCNEQLIPEIEPAPNVTNHPNLHLLDHAMCGPSTNQKIIRVDNSTFLFKYPWMALIAYDTGKPNPDFRCTGTIISSRYVLTAAHCVTSLPAGFRVISVRIGEHDISKERDCETDNNGLEIECSEMYQDFAVESIHFHPEYNRVMLQNDIALIRLNSSVDFNPRNAKPICLPFGTATNLNYKEAVAVVTGWNLMRNDGLHSQTLLHARLPLVAHEPCKKVYFGTSQISYKQLCAGGQLDIDSCIIDSGGPLQVVGMYINRSMRFIQYGIFSYGMRQCGTGRFPDVYTKVAYYMDWILDTMTE